MATTLYADIKPLIDQAARFEFRDLPKVPTNKGIYIMFEKGECDKDGSNRIVRIGKADNLHTRLVNHFEGKQGKSIFRKHLQAALGTNCKEPISTYIQQNISFALVCLPEAFPATKLEAPLITLIADYSKNLNVKNWKGLYHTHPTIRNYKLWNVQHCANRKKTPIGLDDDLMELFRNGLIKNKNSLIF